ncbi:DUF1641 domain-containing protein [Marihabitans asiaticum]|uniref:Uncharacterized protein DUF1641 n=1 Tax=Marihabitans asiaticum TaxID=415218 RepID=A0A560WGJ7_9MICO|nr:DUF1641 domain-containing protein [Marihabitans asiaticum]TWD16660.1 uncharacterized protein DUF1641 [Marihabitans asiaticum]
MTLTPDRTAGRAGEHAASASPPAGQALAATLDDPQVVASLTTILEHADLLAVLIEGLDQLVARSEVIGDSLLAGIDELRDVDTGTAPPLSELARSGMSLASVLPKAAPGIAAAAESGVIERLLSSDIASPEAVEGLAVIARGVGRGSAAFETGRAVDASGVRGITRVLRDPDIQRALTYGATIAKAIGQELAAGRAQGGAETTGNTTEQSAR